ncbi:hypothetical protein [Microbulbifer sp. ARAS458-1]|uniref:hypothetical protein n=1 Tax=Microbulbifer sp. ARAS458-1 TaxID=3140242 RepID=UPI003877EEDC
MNALSTIKNQIDTKTVVSTAVGVGLFGVVTYFAVKSGVRPLKDAAKIAKGGS